MTNLGSVLKSRDITLPIKVHIVKAMVFPVVMYGCDSWTVKKAECNGKWTVKKADCNGKTIALTRRTFVGKVMSLLFNMLSRRAAIHGVAKSRT